MRLCVDCGKPGVFPEYSKGKSGRCQECYRSIANAFNRARSTTTRIHRGYSLKQRFEMQIGKPLPSGCIEWLGNRDGKGYGMIRENSVTTRSHRLAWKLAGKVIPPGALVLHRCDNPSCVNVGHLFIGTNADNMLDKAIKGRAGRALTGQAVRSIRQLLKNGVTQAEIARQFNVNSATISCISTGASWQNFV